MMISRGLVLSDSTVGTSFGDFLNVLDGKTTVAAACLTAASLSAASLIAAALSAACLTAASLAAASLATASLATESLAAASLAAASLAAAAPSAAACLTAPSLAAPSLAAASLAAASLSAASLAAASLAVNDEGNGVNDPGPGLDDGGAAAIAPAQQIQIDAPIPAPPMPIERQYLPAQRHGRGVDSLQSLQKHPSRADSVRLAASDPVDDASQRYRNDSAFTISVYQCHSSSQRQT
jgi:hypothetical protein